MCGTTHSLDFKYMLCMSRVSVIQVLDSWNRRISMPRQQLEMHEALRLGAGRQTEACGAYYYSINHQLRTLRRFVSYQANAPDADFSALRPTSPA